MSLSLLEAVTEYLPSSIHETVGQRAQGKFTDCWKVILNLINRIRSCVVSFFASCIPQSAPKAFVPPVTSVTSGDAIKIADVFAPFTNGSTSAHDRLSAVQAKLQSGEGILNEEITDAVFNSAGMRSVKEQLRNWFLSDCNAADNNIRQNSRIYQEEFIDKLGVIKDYFKELTIKADDVVIRMAELSAFMCDSSEGMSSNDLKNNFRALHLRTFENIKIGPLTVSKLLMIYEIQLQDDIFWGENLRGPTCETSTSALTAEALRELPNYYHVAFTDCVGTSIEAK